MTRFACFALAAALTVMAQSPHADACGGTFCDNPGPNAAPMPVDQSGENILFSMGGGYVEAHVQIQYTGDPERFAWVVPVPEVPELYVGSQLLFDSMLNGTVPTYQVNSTRQSCATGDFNESGGSGCGFGMSASDEASYSDPVDGSGEESKRNDGDVVEARETVGSFDVTILEPASATEISTWLTDNGFLDDANAAPILNEYIAQGHRFVAVKLVPGAGIDEIHPLVIRYPGNEPCIPLKLTRIAATQDMGVRAFFLGDRRVVPTSYRHVEINPLMLDWANVADNYDQVVSKAVDAEPTDGRAFVTEFSGTPASIEMASVYSPLWVSEAFAQIEPVAVIDVLEQQGLASCSGGSCDVFHPLLLPLLRQYLPAPDGMMEAAFYSCLSCYEKLIDPLAWDAVAFEADFETLIAEPAQRADRIVRQASVLTRLYTTISPDEMTADPTFAETSDIATGLDIDRDASFSTACSGYQRMAVGDYGVAMESATVWPAFHGMAYARRIQQFDDSGELVGEVDNSERIDSHLQSWNEAHPEPPDPTRNDAQVEEDDDAGGCACRATGRKSDHGYAFLLVAAVAVARRRWRGRRRAPKMRA